MVVVCREFIGKEVLNGGGSSSSSGGGGGGEAWNSDPSLPTTIVRFGNHHLNVPKLRRLILKVVKIEPVYWAREIRNGLENLKVLLGGR